MNDMREILIEKKRGTCIHFTGTMQRVCKAGVNYDRFKGVAIPCLPMRNTSFSCQGTCECQYLPTDAEIAAKVDQMLAGRDRGRKARAAITEAAAGRVSVQGRIDCPNCGCSNGLSFGIASNGHCAAVCVTPGCVRFQE